MKIKITIIAKRVACDVLEERAKDITIVGGLVTSKKLDSHPSNDVLQSS